MSTVPEPVGTDVAAGAGLRVRVLGPVRAWLGDREVDLGPPLRRCLFGVLAMQQGRALPLREVIAAMWGDATPATATGSVHTYVAGLRRVLEPDANFRRRAGWLKSDDRGYRLDLDPAEVDAHQFRERYATGRRLARLGKLAEAGTEFASATRLWQGVPFHGIPGPFAEAERARLVEVYVAIVEERARAQLSLGEVDAALADELTSLVAQHPLRESLRELVMLVLYRMGRQADALQAFHDARQVLASELGVRPGIALQELYERMLAKDTSFDPSRGDYSPPAAMRSASVPAQLPHDVPNFVSRVAEVSAMQSWATGDHRESPPQRDRVLAIQGAAGVGKTALAVHVAHWLADRFPDGQLYLDLCGFGPRRPISPAQALTQILNSLDPSLGSPDADENVLATKYRNRVAGKRILILLDNAASAEQVVALLPGAASCLVMVTSRNQLTGLALRAETRFQTLEMLTLEDGVALLAAVAGTDRVDTEPAAAHTIAELCAGLPLALRIAAARTVQNPALQLSDVADDLLDSRARLDMFEVADDQATAVRSVFSWSYQALGPEEARTFRMLGLHPTATFSAHAAAALTGQSPVTTGRHLKVLVDGHLIGAPGNDRFQLYDLLRFYAAEQGKATDSWLDRVEAVQRLLDWYINSANAAARELNPRRFRLPPVDDQTHLPGQIALPVQTTQSDPAKSRESALQWFDLELTNLAAATRQAFDAGEYERAWKLPVATVGALPASKQWDERTTTFEFGIRAAERLDDRAAEMRLRSEMGFACIDRGDHTRATALFTAAYTWADSVGDQHLKAVTMQGLILVHIHFGQTAEAGEVAGQHPGIFRDILKTRLVDPELFRAAGLVVPFGSG